MKESVVARKGLSILLLTVLSITFGCASQESTPPNDPSAKDQTASVSTESTVRTLSDQEQQLVGVWLGNAFLDESLVETQFDQQATPELQTSFVDQAESFLSTIIAIQFNDDGTFEQDIEQSVTGLRQTGKGTWRVTGKRDDKVVVETVETNIDGEEVTAERLFRFYPDGNRFAMAAPVSDSLASCNPLLIFGRQAGFSQDRTADAQDEVSR